ncbi:FAD/NAD(P)-binding domain-containing protein [Linderina pennispora]|uniref:NADH:ubiquinone reductase (non-electrogenic) n=1 Tax=Linderina pennispora TaxID=61395 RepID=A0A1Y1VVD3_9FUNG|nr:FAD/NAD(P)-binding domain-containing protein [Linderina pennispora]ORX65248.1 FAD/NAD(P)-binding domain-containing protein [Linderina pennispora]
MLPRFRPTLLAATQRAIYFRARPMSTIVPHTEPQRKTLVLLGTGWGSTTILKNIDTKKFNVVVVSPRNYFLFTPLLPSCTVGTTENRSIMEPIRHIVGKRNVKFYEAECTDVDVTKKQLVLERTPQAVSSGSSNLKTKISYDYLVVGVGGTYNTFGTPGVEEYACFLKEMTDASKIKRRLKDAIENASFDNITESDRSRLLHMVVVGGGPTGVEYAGELHDFMVEDMKRWVPELASKFRITLIEALPNVLSSFDKRLSEYTKAIFEKNNIELRTSTMVKEVKDKVVVVQNPDGTSEELPYGTLVWAAGIRARQFAHTLREKLPDAQTNHRGLVIDQYLRVKGAQDIWALGDCTVTENAPLAQVASQQGKWLSRSLNMMARDRSVTDTFCQMEERAQPFKYVSNGSLAYIGGEKAIAELPFFNQHITVGGPLTSVMWKGYCLWELSSVRSSMSVATDWIRRALFGRTVSVD